MKCELRNREDLFFFNAGNQLVVCQKKPYKINHEIIEMQNYLPEAFLFHHYQMENHRIRDTDALNQGEARMLDMDVRTDEIQDSSIQAGSSFSADDLRLLARLDDDEDEDDEDWDEDEDEDWDEDEYDEEEWDEDEEDWDEDEEDEDWDEDEEDEDWEEEE